MAKKDPFGEGFIVPEDLKVNLFDPLEAIHTTAPVHAESLPITAYTAGDTSGEEAKPLETPMMAGIPSNILRRYSPVNIDEKSSAIDPPAPEFLERPEENYNNTVVPFQYKKIQQTNQLPNPYKKKNQERREEKTSVGNQAASVVMTDPEVAKLLRLQGKSIPQEALFAEKKVIEEFSLGVVSSSITAKPIKISRDFASQKSQEETKIIKVFVSDKNTSSKNEQEKTNSAKNQSTQTIKTAKTLKNTHVFRTYSGDSSSNTTINNYVQNTTNISNSNTFEKGDELILDGSDFGKIGEQVYIKLSQNNEVIVSQNSVIQEGNKLSISTSQVKPGKYDVTINNASGNESNSYSVLITGGDNNAENSDNRNIFQGDNIVLNSTDIGDVSEQVFVKLVQDNKTITSKNVTVQEGNKLSFSTTNIAPGQYSVVVSNAEGKEKYSIPLVINNSLGKTETNNVAYSNLSNVYKGDELVINSTDYGKINEQIFVKLIQDNRTLLSQSMKVQEGSKIIIQTDNISSGDYYIDINNSDGKSIDPITVSIKDGVNNYSSIKNSLLQEERNISKTTDNSVNLIEHTHVHQDNNIYNVNNEIVAPEQSEGANPQDSSETVVIQEFHETPQSFNQNINSENINTRVHNITNKAVHNVKNENVNLEQNTFQTFNSDDAETNFRKQNEPNSSTNKNDTNTENTENNLDNEISDGFAHSKAIEEQKYSSQDNTTNHNEDILNRQIIDRTDILTTNENGRPEGNFNYSRQSSDASIDAETNSSLQDSNEINRTQSGEAREENSVPIAEEKFKNTEENKTDTFIESETGFDENQQRYDKGVNPSAENGKNYSPIPQIKSVKKNDKKKTSQTSLNESFSTPIQEEKQTQNESENLEESVNPNIKYKELEQENRYKPLYNAMRPNTKSFKEEVIETKKEIEAQNKVSKENSKSSEKIIKSLQSVRGQFSEIGNGKTLNVDTIIKNAEKTISKIVASKLPPKISKVIDNINAQNNLNIPSVETIRQDKSVPRSYQGKTPDQFQNDVNKIVSEILSHKNDMSHIESYVRSILAQHEMHLDKKWQKDFRKRWENEINK